MRLADLSFTLTLASCLVMVGVIWVIQLVHYPLFAKVGTGGFADYHADHTRLITFVVMPTMLVELVTAALLVASRPAFMPAWSAYAGAALVAVAWAGTALLSVPAHGRLAGGFAPDVHRALVSTNWLRTAAWSGRAAILGWVCLRGLQRASSP